MLCLIIGMFWVWISDIFLKSIYSSRNLSQEMAKRSSKSGEHYQILISKSRVVSKIFACWWWWWSSPKSPILGIFINLFQLLGWITGVRVHYYLLILLVISSQGRAKEYVKGECSKWVREADTLLRRDISGLLSPSMFPVWYRAWQLEEWSSPASPAPPHCSPHSWQLFLLITHCTALLLLLPHHLGFDMLPKKFRVESNI